MELIVTQSHHIVAHAITDNPYQARNFLLPHLTSTHTLIDDHSLLTAFGLLIKTTPEISPLLNSTPRCINEVPFPTVKPAFAQTLPKSSSLIPLRAICIPLNLQPIVARRILRKHFGAQNIRYEWPKDQVPSITQILRNK